MAAFGKIVIFVLMACIHCTVAELLQEVCLKKERVCEGSSLTISCPGVKKIQIVRALYGRIKGDKVCPYNGFDVFGAINTSNTNCRASDALKIVEDLCEGKSSCTVAASNDVFGDPCLLTYKYLEVTYNCSKPKPK